MKAAFTLAILCVAVFYTYWAFAELSFLSSAGRLGPGFFPRIVGILLIVACLLSLAVDLRHGEAGEERSEFWRVTLVVVALTGLFVALLNVLGGLMAMILFMLASLLVLNRGRPVQTIIFSLALPIAVFLMFDVWLNAAVPEGMFGF